MKLRKKNPLDLVKFSKACVGPKLLKYEALTPLGCEDYRAGASKRVSLLGDSFGEPIYLEFSFKLIIFVVFPKFSSIRFGFL